MWGRLGRSKTVIVACAVIALSGIAFARRTCNTASYGDQKGREVHIQDQHLSPKASDWRIRVPPVCSKIVGVSVTACDVSGAPGVFLSSLTHGVVMRTGRYSTGAYLYVTAFCDTNEDDLFEIPRPQLPPRLYRPPSRPLGIFQQNSQQPITLDQLHVMSPTQRPRISSEYTVPWSDKPVVLGINPYSMPNFKPSTMPVMYRSEETTTTEAPKIDSVPSNSTNTTTPSPGRSRYSVEGLKPGTWTPQEIEHLHVTNEPLSGDDSIWPLTFLRQLAQWWLRHVRSWSGGGRPKRRMMRRFGSRGQVPRWSNTAIYPMYFKNLIDFTRM